MNDKIIQTARDLVKEISKYGITCDTMASDRLYAFIKALIESRCQQYIDAGNNIKILDNDGVGRKKAIIYSLLTIGSMHLQQFDIFTENNDINNYIVEEVKEIDYENY